MPTPTKVGNVATTTDGAVEMGTTESGNDWDVSYVSDVRTDVVMVDTGDSAVYLSVSDLIEMLEALDVDTGGIREGSLP